MTELTATKHQSVKSFPVWLNQQNKNMVHFILCRWPYKSFIILQQNFHLSIIILHKVSFSYCISILCEQTSICHVAFHITIKGMFLNSVWKIWVNQNDSK